MISFHADTIIAHAGGAENALPISRVEDGLNVLKTLEQIEAEVRNTLTNLKPEFLIDSDA
jgi:hypothetical protein